MGRQRWTHEEVLSRIRELHENGAELSLGNALAVAPRLVSAAVRYFGSWRSAVTEVGIDYSAIAQVAHQRALERKTKWSKELVIQRIHELVEKKEPLQTALISQKYPALYAAACSPRYFNGWANALQAAGVSVVRGKPGRPSEHTVLLNQWRVELLLERIRQIAASSQTLDERHISMLAPELHAAAIRRFGSWAEVVQAVRRMDGPDDADLSSANA